MSEYVECQECAFVLQAGENPSQPKFWDSCPDCGNEEFAVIEREEPNSLREPRSVPLANVRGE